MNDLVRKQACDQRPEFPFQTSRHIPIAAQRPSWFNRRLNQRLGVGVLPSRAVLNLEMK